MCVRIWGMIYYLGPVAFCKVEGKLNSDTYPDILKERLVNNYYLNNTFVGFLF